MTIKDKIRKMFLLSKTEIGLSPITIEDIQNHQIALAGVNVFKTDEELAFIPECNNARFILK